MNIEKTRYYVDVPPSSFNFDEWHNVEDFDSYEEALKFAQDNFGADEKGMVCLISES